MTQTLAPSQPMTVAPQRARNPLVAPSLFRRAGAHRRSGGALRRRATQALRREIAGLPPPHHE